MNDLSKKQTPRKGKPRLTASNYLSEITAALLDQSGPAAPRTRDSGPVSPVVASAVAVLLDRDLPGQNSQLLEVEANLRLGKKVSPVALAALPSPRLLSFAVGMMTEGMQSVLKENQRLRAVLAEYIAPLSDA